MTFEEIGKALGRNEVAVAAIFYGQAKPSEEDCKKLSSILGLDQSTLLEQTYGWPDRGRSVPMPPREPLIYRLYEIVQNYGYAYKVRRNLLGESSQGKIAYLQSCRPSSTRNLVRHEYLVSLFLLLILTRGWYNVYLARIHLLAFVNPSRSAISYSTKVEKETDDKGDWVVITLRGKWYS